MNKENSEPRRKDLPLVKNKAIAIMALKLKTFK